jgi:class 3 adenylate cyclase
MQAVPPLYADFQTLLPDDAARWAAVQHRDGRADGVLYYAVTTTGVYCRPTCPARRPHRRNVLFYGSCEAAEAAGFRSCKRCRPTAAARPRAGDGWSVRPAAVLFVDIKGFTPLATRLPPDAALALLAEFHARLGAVVTRCGGVVHKHLGDGLMALFGDRVSRPGDAAGAVASGLGIQDALADWNRERRASRQPAIAAGIGVHYGMAAFAHRGGSEVVGDTVNIASRLERLTRRLGALMVVSDDAMRAMSPHRRGEMAPRLARLGTVRVSGSRPRRLWGVFGTPGRASR